MEVINGEFTMAGCDPADPSALRSFADAADLIHRIGFLPLFSNSIPGFSIEEHVPAKQWWTGVPDKDPWEWRMILAADDSIAYGKFFNRGAGFISKEMFPAFANYRRNGYDFEALFEDELASYRAKKVMDVFEMDDESVGKEILTSEVKNLAGFGKDGGEKNFEGVLTELQMQTYLIISSFRQRKNKKGESYGWHLGVASTPETKWGREFVTDSYSEDPRVSWEKIAARMKKHFPEAADDQIRKLLGINYPGETAKPEKEKKQKIRLPKEWIIPANPKYYDIEEAFEKSDEIEWKQGAGIKEGDTVFIYVAAPVSAILYKCAVTKTDIPFEYDNGKVRMKALMKIRLEKRYPRDRFTFDVLGREYGIFAVRGPRGIPESLGKALGAHKKT